MFDFIHYKYLIKLFTVKCFGICFLVNEIIEFFINFLQYHNIVKNVFNLNCLRRNMIHCTDNRMRRYSCHHKLLVLFFEEKLIFK